MGAPDMEDAFLDFYGFSHDPFASRVPGFKFFPAQRKPLLAQLHELAQDIPLLVVTGPSGSGKSLLRQALAASANKALVDPVALSPQPGMDGATLLEQLSEKLGSKAGRLPEVLAALQGRTFSGHQVYVLVDDAEELEDSGLEVLLSLARAPEEFRPHVFLFGEPALAARVRALSDEGDLFQVIALSPYTADETRQYLASRLQGAGVELLEVFDDEQVRDIHRDAHGWPGLINEVARERLIDDMLEAQTAAEEEAPEPSRFGLSKANWLVMAVVVAVVAAGWIRLVWAPKEGRPVAQDSSSASVEKAAEPAASSGVPSAQQESTVPLAEIAPSEGPGASAAPAPQPEVSPAPAEPAVPEEPEDAVAASPSPSPSPPVKAPAVERPSVERKVTPPPRPSTPIASSASTADDAWYRGVPGSRYTLQVVGTRSEAKAKSYVGQHGAGFRYFRKVLDGKPLYVVTFGSFADHDAASRALGTLPADVRSNKPWPRSFSSIQEDLRRH